MKRVEVDHAVLTIIQCAIERGKADWRDVAEVFRAIGRLTPEPTIKPTVPPYDESLVHRTRKLDFTDEQRQTTRAVLRDLGLI